MLKSLVKMMNYVIHTVGFLRFRASSSSSSSTPPLRTLSTASASASATATSLKPSSQTLTLTEEQQNLLDAISQGKSVFLTGSAGTGKSFLLLRAIELLNRIHDPNEVFVTASTGVAACALCGQTLHSFAGVGLGVGDRELLLARVRKNKPAAKRWNRAKALVIDEVSMISTDLFDNLEYIARMVRRRKGARWGGIQVIASGDFFQLPPINKAGREDGREFAFEADCWGESFDLQLELTRVFRQCDKEFVDLLQGIRRGERADKYMRILSKCSSDGTEPLEMVPRLYPRNQDVMRVNKMRLEKLGRDIVKFVAMDSGDEPWKSQLKNVIVPDELEMCLGARVMLVKNKDLQSGLVNGSTGTVTGFVKNAKGLLPRVKFDSGVEIVVEPEKWELMEGETVLARRKQIPLILAWAVSIHKCQGTTLNSLHTDLSRAFGCGMVYVALSRVRSLNGLYLSGFDPKKIKAHPKVLQFYQDQFGSCT